MRLCRFDNDRLGLVEHGTVRDVTAALDELPACRYPFPTHDVMMAELGKVRRVVETKHPGSPHEVLLVIDATSGQNALIQARQFLLATGVTGVCLAKLDGTSKGGIVFAIAEELGIPVRFAGTGERLGDIAPFDATAFVDALLADD